MISIHFVFVVRVDADLWERLQIHQSSEIDAD